MSSIRIIKQFKKKFSKKDPYFWVFSSYNGKYCDSPKVVSEFIHNNYPNIKIHWLLDGSFSENIPDYINKLDIKSDKDKKYALDNASILIDNIEGQNHSILFESNFKKKLQFKIVKFFNKNKHQNIISFWHGFQNKKGINECKDLKSKDVSLGNLWFFLDSNYSINVMKRRYKQGHPKFYLCQNPRNYYLFDKIDKNTLKKQFDLPEDKKIILYAPTFRGENNSSSIDILNSGLNQLMDFNLDELFASCKKKFGGDFILVLRFHQLTLKLLKEINISDKYNGKVFLGNKSFDVGDYLSISDILISDYSGIAFDFMLTKKPIFLYTPDYKEYVSKRGLNILPDECPFDNASSFGLLLEKINNFNLDIYEKNIHDYMVKTGFCNYESINYDAIKKIVKLSKIK